MSLQHRSIVLLLTLSLLVGCGQPPSNSPNAPDVMAQLTAEELEVESDRAEMIDAPSTATELDWDALIPEDWRPDALLDALDVDAIADEDPRAIEVMDKLMALWKTAPVVKALDGTRVRLPGFVVPVGFDPDGVSEFLLVPYYGACIHVPPPPANQIVHVALPTGETYRGDAFDTLWVTGTLRVEPFSSDMADAGYRIEATELAPYE